MLIAERRSHVPWAIPRMAVAENRCSVDMNEHLRRAKSGVSSQSHVWKLDAVTSIPRARAVVKVFGPNPESQGDVILCVEEETL